MSGTGQPRIRTATQQDLDRLHYFETTYFGPDQFSRRQVQYLLTKAHATTLVLERDGEIAGSATMVWRRNSTTGRLYSIVVDRASQGKGYAARLLAACEAEALRHGCTTVRLEVRVNNLAAKLLYERHGYTIERTLPEYYTDGTDGLRMVKRLTEPARRNPARRVTS